MNKIIKKIGIIVLVLGLLLSIGGCSTAPDTSSSEESSKPAESSESSEIVAPETGKEKISYDGKTQDPATAGVEGKVVGLALNALDEYQTEWKDLLLEAGKAYGIEIVITNADSKMDKQLADVESLIARKVDLLIIRCVDNQGIIPAFEAAKEAGIPTIDSAFGAKYDETLSINSSQYFSGSLQGEYCNQWLEADPARIMKVGYLWGSQGSSNIQLRYQGWRDKVDENSDRVEVLAEQVTNWSVVDAMAVVEDWLQAYSDMNVIVGASDELAIAATNVLSAAGRRDDFMVVGLDGSINAQKLIREGVLDASVYTSKKADTKITIEYVVRILQGEDLTGKYLELEKEITTLMTKDNIDEVLNTLG